MSQGLAFEVCKLSLSSTEAGKGSLVDACPGFRSLGLLNAGYTRFQVNLGEGKIP